MKAEIIKTEKQYEMACKRIYELIHSQKELIEPNTAKGDEIEILALLVEKYENENNFKMKAPDPVEAIKFRMDQMNLKQKEVAPLFGGETRVSEVLNKVRPLTMKMIYNLNHYLGIPFESLMNENSKFKLKPQAKRKLMKNPSISRYISKNKQKELAI